MTSTQNIHHKISILDKSLNSLIYRDTKKARFLIQELGELIDESNDSSLKLLYHWRKASVCNQDYDYEQAAELYEKAIVNIESSSDLKEQIDCYLDYTGVLINLGNFEKCRLYFSKIKQLLKVFPNDIFLARLKTRTASFYLNNANYDKAVECFQEADKIFSKNIGLDIKDKYFMTILQSGLGNIYEHNGDTKASVLAYNKVLEICEEEGIHSRLSWHYLHAGLACMAEDNFKQAKVYFEKSIKFDDDSSMPARAGSFANMGYCYFVNEDFKNALYYYDTAEEIYRKINADDHVNLFFIQLWKSQVYSRLDKKEKESEFLLQAYDLAKKSKDNKVLSIVYSNIANFYAEREDYELAYKYQQMHTSYAEAYFEEMKSRQISELQIKYDAEKKDQESEMLKLEANRLQLKALRAQMNPHFIHNALNSIQHFINTNEKESAGKYLAQFANLMRNSLYYSDMESISLEDEIEFLKEYLEINKKLRYSDQMKYEVHIDDEIEEDLISLPSMIIQPYVENALEHGIRTRTDGKVEISFYYHDDDTLKCVVEDNGIGRDMARHIQLKGGYHEKHRSMGTAITQKRLEVLKSSFGNENLQVNIIDLKDDFGVAKGTRVELMIPILEFRYK